MKSLISCLLGLAALAATVLAQPPHLDDPWPSADEAIVESPAVRHIDPCINGLAGGFPCSNVDLLEFMPASTIGGGSGNDIWGWTDPESGREYALLGRSTGASFIDITDPENPVYLGNLPPHSVNNFWRDLKVYQNHVFVVSEAVDHGMQVFDLTQLRDVPNPPATFSETAHYPNFGRAHNIVINEDSGFAYAVGSVQGTEICASGLHMIDIQDPVNPTFAGCYADDGYTHDAQCVIYSGPDLDHQGSEICLAANEDTLTIVDVTDKSNPVLLAREGYVGVGYAHQGWLTDDQVYFLLDDELDESFNGHTTRTYVWDVADLDNPAVVGQRSGTLPFTDHNQYIHDGHTYQANYRGGLRILRLDDLATADLTEVAYFDTVPGSNAVGASGGAWSVYPFFASGHVIIGDSQGLFIVRPSLCSVPESPASLTATAAGDQRIDLAWDLGAVGETYSVYRSFGTCPGADFQQIASGLTSAAFSDTTVSGQVDYAYYVTTTDITGGCESIASPCATASTTGACTAPPLFGGAATVTNQATPSCQLEVSWDAALPNCGASATYAVYRDLEPDFTPSPANRVATGLTATSWVDALALSGETYAYVARATDTDNGSQDDNRMVRLGTATGPAVDGSWEAGAEIGDPGLIATSPGANPEPQVRHIGWEVSEARQNSGARSYFSTYADSQCAALATPPLDLTTGESSQLSFWTAYQIETAFDGGVVEISTDGGDSWQLLPLDAGYPSAFNNSGDACGYTSGDPSFSGTALTWSKHTADLAAFAGMNVQIRWVFSTDGGLTLEGWYLDDIAISHAQISGPCDADVVVFEDGFESGDTQLWSAGSR